MSVLMMAAILAVGICGQPPGEVDFVVAPKWSPPRERPFRYSLSATALPTGPTELGVGQGANDLLLQADLAYQSGPVLVAASLGYQLMADPAWRNPASVSVSITRRLKGEADVGAALDAAQSIAPGFPAQASLSVFAAKPLGRRDRLDLRLWQGLTRLSGGFGAGLAFTRRF